MPFTIAHAAAVLPFLPSGEERVRRRWFDATCLVTGSMAPDFEYFLHARMESNLSHTSMGLVVFDVPVALAVAIVFHALVRAPLAFALPCAIHARFARFLSTSWRPRVHVAVASALIGAITHLAWDACTHRTGWLVRALPALEANALIGGLPAYRALQHASTAVGLALLVVVVARMPRQFVAGVSWPVARGARVAHVARGVFVVLPLAIGVGSAMVRVAVEPGGRMYGHAIAAFIAGALVGICAAALLVSRIGQPPHATRS